MSELQVMWWLCRMEGRVNMLFSSEDDTTNGTTNNTSSRRRPSYMVLGNKYPYGVDYGNYMHRVAEDIGAAPTLSALVAGPGGGGFFAAHHHNHHPTKGRHHHHYHHNPFKALYTYCFGQSYVSLFRLVGPFQSQRCWDIVETELYNVCINRGYLENFGLIIVCYISLWMNLTACIIELIWCFLTLKQPQFFVRYG